MTFAIGALATLSPRQVREIQLRIEKEEREFNANLRSLSPDRRPSELTR
jgi:hypothetical protein